MRKGSFCINRLFRIRFRNVSFLLLSALCVLCGDLYAQDWKPVADGVEYARVTREFSGKPVNINLLRLDLRKVRLDVHHALDRAIGTEKTSSIATRHGAFAAINAGFFRLDGSLFAGDASNTLIIDGKTFSEEIQGRTALVIENLQNRSEVIIHPLLPSRDYFKVGNPKFRPEIPLSGLNRERKNSEVILYGSEFGATTLTDQAGTDLVLTKCSSRQESRGFWFTTCANHQIRSDSRNAPIPKKGYVISFGPNALQPKKVFEQEMVRFRGGKRPYIYFDISILGLDVDTLLYAQPSTDVVSGVPQLIKNGKIDITWEQEKASRSFVETRHPRTAVAKLKGGKFLMLTADGRTDESAGLDLYDLAKYMLELGAVDAMNLDGGGSTTMFLDGKVVNRPSDKDGERKVGDAILVTLRKKLQKPAR